MTKLRCAACLRLDEADRLDILPSLGPVHLRHWNADGPILVNGVLYGDPSRVVGQGQPPSPTYQNVELEWRVGRLGPVTAAVTRPTTTRGADYFGIDE